MSSTKVKSSRAAHRRSTKTIVSSVKEICASFGGEKSLQAKLLSYKVTLKEKLEILEKLDETVLESIENDAEIDKEIQESTDFRGFLQETCTEIDLCLKEYVKNEQPEHGATPGAVDTSVISSLSSKQASVKLSKIVLKKFDGNPTNFQSFWDSYNTAIHENEDISDVNKMAYLFGLLEGPAYSAVKGFTMTSGNYKEVIDVLHERFGSKDVIISSHMDALLKLPLVYNSDTKRLRSVYDLIEQNIRGLKTLGISSKEYGSLLLPILMSRLPQEFKPILTRNVPKDKWSLDSLLLAFKEELEAREKCVQLNASMAAEKGKVITKGQFPVTAQTLVAEQVRRKKQGSTNNLYCAFCNQVHQSTMCPIITDPRARREALKRAGKCYNCVRPGHLSRSCQSKATCFTCGLRHHSSICSQNMMGKSIAQASSTNAMIPLSPQPGAGLPSNTENNQSKPVTTAVIYQSEVRSLAANSITFNLST